MQYNLSAGARNLLVACAGMQAGGRLLILHESADYGFYDRGIVEAVADEARAMGLDLTIMEIPFHPSVDGTTVELTTHMQAADKTLFFARLGDQLRFSDTLADVRPIISYALDAQMLGSAFGQAPYQAFVELKDAVNDALAVASDIRVTCPLGTDFGGPFARFPAEQSDVSIARFPMSVFTPVPTTGFSGRIVQQGFLVGTGSQYYEPYGIALGGPVAVNFQDERITGFEGEAADVAVAEAHYAHVGATLGIAPHFIHSWHAGIHPGCAYTQPAAQHFERWSGGAFGNPRLLHFHSCGAYAPGEISLNVLDPTIAIDGVAVWEAGVFCPERMAAGAEVFERYPALAGLFEAPVQEVGQGFDGQLSGIC